jgi:hypothetical protein
MDTTIKKEGEQKTAASPNWLFSPGRIVTTRAAMKALTLDDIRDAIDRHLRGDWGVVDEEDWAQNVAALSEEGRLVSVYLSEEQVCFWIITEADRSATTVLLPSDY